MAKIAQIFSEIIVLPIYLYRLLISPLFGQKCRFDPSCSAYAITAIRKLGPIKGTWLACKRILKCHPYNEGGYDPVPDTLKNQSKEK